MSVKKEIRNEWDLHRLFQSSMWLHARLRRTSSARRLSDWSRLLSVQHDTLEGTSRRTDHWHPIQERMQISRPKMTTGHCKAFGASQQRIFVLRSHFPMKSRSQWRRARYSCRNSNRWSNWHDDIPACHELEACGADRRIDWLRSLQIGRLGFLPCRGHRHRYGLPWSWAHHWHRLQSRVWSRGH